MFSVTHKVQKLYGWNENVGNNDEMYENGDRAERNIVMDMI